MLDYPVTHENEKMRGIVSSHFLLYLDLSGEIVEDH
jgi:hypothetical protein